MLGIALLACGLLVVSGLFTAIVHTAVVAILLGIMTYRVVIVYDPISPEHWQIWAFELTTAVSLVLMGPGWFSIDARLFGRREIVFQTRTDR